MNTTNRLHELLAGYVSRTHPSLESDKVAELTARMEKIGFYIEDGGHLRPAGSAEAYSAVCKIAPRAVNAIEVDYIARTTPNASPLDVAEARMRAMGSSLSSALDTGDMSFGWLPTDGGAQ